MYLSNVDIKAAIDNGSLIVDPRPEHFGCGYDETSIDLHLDNSDMARVWDADSMATEDQGRGRPPLGGRDWQLRLEQIRSLASARTNASQETRGS